MLQGQEKRKFFRHPVHAPLRLQVEQETSLDSRAEDLSFGGLSFLSDRRFSKGASLEVSILVKQKLFNVKGRVVYSIEDHRSGRFRSGISFTDSPSAFKAKLAEEALQIINYRTTLSRRLGREVSEEEAAEKWINENAESFPSKHQ